MALYKFFIIIIIIITIIVIIIIIIIIGIIIKPAWNLCQHVVKYYIIEHCLALRMFA